MTPGRMWSPSASITCLPSGKVSLVPIATNFPSAMARPPCVVASGVTIQPFRMTRSAFIEASIVLCAHTSVCIEYPLDVVRVIRPGECQRQQEPGFPWLQIVAGDESAPVEPGAAHDPARRDATAEAHDHATLLEYAVE